MADSVHIAGLSAHKIAGPLLIIKAEVLLQKLAVYLVSHVIECSLGRSLKDNLIEKTQDTGKQGGADQKRQELWQQTVIASLDDIIHNNAGNVRIDDGEGRDNGSQEQPQDHQSTVLLQK